MADRGDGENRHRSGGSSGRARKYWKRRYKHNKRNRTNPRKDNDRSRDDPRDSRDRNDRRRHDRDRSRDRSDRYRADDRDRVHKPSRGGRNHNAGIGHADRASRIQRASAERDSHDRPPPTGPRDPNSRFRPTMPSSRANGEAKVKAAPEYNMKVEAEGVELSETEKISRLMGFKKFKSTKNTKVPGNEYNYAVRKEKQTTYRQYMNRQGGFNRPLSPSR